ncbi:hypothetical protein KGQ71_03295, partial [Patescibacteria group bacterium]|nr:hypothetical protein [Patescibacteria group bacterium]
MGKISSRQSTGSSLLITVLIMTVVGMVVLVVSRNAILSTRVASQNDSSNLAFQMAMTGLEDGRLRAQLFGGAPLTAQGEFGDLTSTASNPHIVNPRRRGYLMTDASSACTNPGSDQSVSTSATTVNQSCPYYDLAVYRLITITPTTSFYYTDKEIPPNNTAVNLKILQTNNPGFTLTPHFLNAGDPNAKMTVQAGTYSCT